MNDSRPRVRPASTGLGDPPAPDRPDLSVLAFAGRRDDRRLAWRELFKRGYSRAAITRAVLGMRREAAKDGCFPEPREARSAVPADLSIRPARPGDLEARDATVRCHAALDAQAEADELEAKGDSNARRARIRADALSAKVFAPPSRRFERKVASITRARLRAEADRCRPGRRVVVQREAQRAARRSGTNAKPSSSGSDDSDSGGGEPEPPVVWPARFERPDWWCATPGCEDRREPDSRWCWGRAGEAA